MTDTTSTASQTMLTVITGSFESRAKLDPSFADTLDHSYGNILQARPSVLIVDSMLFHHAIRPTGNRYVLVVSTCTELASLISRLTAIHPTSNDVIIAGRTSCRFERAAIRLQALRMGGCGVVIARDVGGSAGQYADGQDGDTAVRKLETILQAWTGPGDSAVNQTSMDNVWGAAQWANDDDVSIPPGWDSVEKIRSVTEASGSSLEDVERLLSKATETGDGVKHSDESDDADEKKQQITSHAKSWLAQHNQWKHRMEAKRDQIQAIHENVGKATPDTTSEDSHPMLNGYFQQLLARRKR